MKRSRSVASALMLLPFLVAAPPREAPGADEVALRSEASAAVVAAALALLETIPDEPAFVEQMVGLSRSESVRLPLDDEAREDMSYWPRPRAGLAIGQMNAAQREATQRLLASALSAKGQLKVMHIVQLERVLQALDAAGISRDIGNYRLAIFGQPSADRAWGWRFEGHHVSLNLTVAPAGVRVTPSFLGADPARIPHGPLGGFRTLRVEEDLGRALVGSLGEKERAKAVLSGAPPPDVLSGAFGKSRAHWDEWKRVLSPDGIALSEVGETSRRIAILLLDEVVTTYRPELVAAYRSEIEVDRISFAWLGSTEPGEPHYYRLQGEDFVFEYDNVQNDGNHVHTVWRDRRRDFGKDLLAEHYREAH